MPKFLIFFLGIISSYTCFAVSDSLLYKNVTYKMRFSYHIGSTFSHSPKAKYAENGPVNGFEMELIRKRNDTIDTHYNPKGFLSGFGINYFVIDNPVLKNNLNLFYTLEATIIKLNKLDIAIKANGGLNFVSGVHDTFTNRINFSYSSYVNAHLAWGFIAHLNINPKTEIGAKLMLNHFSNGGIKDPNLGVNFVTASLFYQTNIANNVYKKINFKKRISAVEKKANLQFYAFATYTSTSVNINNFFLINGIGISYNKPYGLRKNRGFAIGFEWLKDRAMDEFLIYRAQTHLSTHRVAVFIGHEFLFHQFTWGQYLGYNIFKDVPYVGDFYHRHTILYKMNKTWSIGISLFANNRKANFTDLRLVYKLCRKG